MMTSTVRRFGVGVASLALVAGMSAPAFADVINLPNGGKVDLDKQRLAGQDRVGTALALAKKVFPSATTTPEIAYIVGYDATIDAATSGMLNKGPVLATPKDQTTQQMLGATIKQEFPTVRKVVAVGGTAAVSDAALKNIADAAGVARDRVSGANRYSTAVAIANHMWTTKPSRVYITRGDTPVDALTAGTLEKGPILLINHEGNVDKSVVEYIAKNNISWNQIAVIGGKNAVPDEQVAKLFKAADIPDAPEVTPWTAEEVKLMYVDAVKRSAAVYFGQNQWQQSAGGEALPGWHYGDGKTSEDISIAATDVKKFWPLDRSGKAGKPVDDESAINTTDPIDVNPSTGKKEPAFEGYLPIAPKVQAANVWANGTASGDAAVVGLIRAYDAAKQAAINSKVTVAQMLNKGTTVANDGVLADKFYNSETRAKVQALENAIPAFANIPSSDNDKKIDGSDGLAGANKDAAVAMAKAIDALNGNTALMSAAATTDVDAVAAAFDTVVNGGSTVNTLATFVGDTDSNNVKDGQDAYNKAIAYKSSTQATALYKAMVALLGQKTVDDNWPTVDGGGNLNNRNPFTFDVQKLSGELKAADVDYIVKADMESGAKLIFIDEDGTAGNGGNPEAPSPSKGYNGTIADVAKLDATTLGNLFAKLNGTGGNENQTVSQQKHEINWWAVKNLINQRTTKFNQGMKDAKENLIKAVRDYNLVGKDNATSQNKEGGSKGPVRISGANRYQTSALLSIFQSKEDSGKPGQIVGESRFDDMKAVYLASGDNDHLIDPVFAGMVQNGTILLVPTTGKLDPFTVLELKRKGSVPRLKAKLTEGISPSKAYAVGGKASISDDVFKESVEAMAGKTK